MSNESSEKSEKDRMPRWNERYRKKGSEVGIDQENVIVALNEETAYALSPAVYYVWSMCDGETTVGNIVEALKSSISEEISTEELYDAVVEVIDKLLEANLLEKVL